MTSKSRHCCLALLLAVGVSAATAQGCRKSDNDGPPPIKNATYADANFNGLVDLGDAIVVEFRKAVDFPNGTVANLVFRLRGGAGAQFDNATLLVAGLTPEQVILPILGSTVIRPNGKYTRSGPSTGIEVRSGQLLLTYLDSGKTVKSGRAVDIEGDLKPHVLSAAWVDVDLSNTPTLGDQVVVSFTTNVDVLTALPDEAFQVIPPVLGAFGTLPVFLGSTQDVSLVTIVLGVSPALVPFGIYDPLDPLLGPSGLEVGLIPDRIADTAYPELFAGPHLAPGVDIAE